jgi:hypothetical protein
LTSWPFSFAGKISRAGSDNKKRVAGAAERLRFPCRYQAGTVCSNGAAAGLCKVEIEEIFHASTLDVAKILIVRGNSRITATQIGQTRRNSFAQLGLLC